jgi:hypothetical protein
MRGSAMISQYFSTLLHAPKTPSGYIFRLRTSGDLKADFGKSEFRFH